MQLSARHFHLRVLYYGRHNFPLNLVRSEMERVYMTSQMRRSAVQYVLAIGKAASEIRTSGTAASCDFSFGFNRTADLLRKSHLFDNPSESGMLTQRIEAGILSQSEELHVSVAAGAVEPLHHVMRLA